MTLPTTFKKADVTRLLKACLAAGERPSSIEIDPSGKIVARFGAGAGAGDEASGNEWDEVLEDGQGERAAAERH